MPFHMRHHAETDAVDLLLEVDQLDKIIPLCDDQNYKRVCFLIVQVQVFFLSLFCVLFFSFRGCFSLRLLLCSFAVSLFVCRACHDLCSKSIVRPIRFYLLFMLTHSLCLSVCLYVCPPHTGLPLPRAMLQLFARHRRNKRVACLSSNLSERTHMRRR